MIDVVCDASVVVKWWAKDEDEADAAEAIKVGHEMGAVNIRLLDLTFYEVGNAFARSHKLPAQTISAHLDALHSLCGAGLRLTPYRRTATVDVASAFGLSFYDAAYFVVSTLLDFDLVSSDSDLIEMDAEAPGAYCERLGLPVG